MMLYYSDISEVSVGWRSIACRGVLRSQISVLITVKDTRREMPKCPASVLYHLDRVISS